MTEKAQQILQNTYKAYSEGLDYTIATPAGGQIHAFNMALRELEPYIAFKRRDMVKTVITLTLEGLEYCMEGEGAQ